MSFIRWRQPGSIFQEFDRIQRDMNRLWSNMGGSDSLAGSHSHVFPPLNLYSADNAYVVECELPGFKLEDIDITINNDTLLVKGEKNEELPDNVSIHRRERVNGSFSRSRQLPDAVDAERTTAVFKNGVLSIELPKAEHAKPKKITVASE